MEEEQGTKGITLLISRLRVSAPCEVAQGCRRQGRAGWPPLQHGYPFAVKLFDLLPSSLNSLGIDGGGTAAFVLAMREDVTSTIGVVQLPHNPVDACQLLAELPARFVLRFGEVAWVVIE